MFSAGISARQLSITRVNKHQLNAALGHNNSGNLRELTTKIQLFKIHRVWFPVVSLSNICRIHCQTSACGWNYNCDRTCSYDDNMIWFWTEVYRTCTGEYRIACRYSAGSSTPNERDYAANNLDV